MLLLPFFLSVTLSVLVIIVFITRKEHDNVNRWLSAAILLTVIFQMFIYFIMTTGRLADFWYLFRMGCPFYCLTPPLVYFYIIHNLKVDPKPFRYYLWHFIPFGISLLDVGWYYLNTSSADRISEIAMIQHHPSEEFFLGAGFLPPVVHYYFRLIQRVFYISLQWHALLTGKAFCKANRTTYKWTFFLTAAQTAIMIGYGYLASSIFFTGPETEGTFGFEKELSLLVIFLGIIAICIYLFMYPEILYGTLLPTPNDAKDKKPQDSEPQNPEPKSANTEKYEWMPKGTNIHDLCTKLETFMEKDKPFLQKRISLSYISQKTDIPTHLLSAVLNKYYGKSFSDFINEYRIRQILLHIKENPNWDQLTIEGIAYEAGFSSRTAFYNAFKKLIGKSPGVYLAEITKRKEVLQKPRQRLP